MDDEPGDMWSTAERSTTDMGRLVVSIRGEPERALQILQREIVVGRAGGCDLLIPHPTSSSRHFRFYVTFFEEGKTEPLVFCEDLNSTNGTYVNGRTIGRGESVLLFGGDKIEILQAASFVFQCSSTPEPLDAMSVKDQQIFSPTYELTNRLLGTGSYGRVILARETKTSRQVACKVVGMKNYLKDVKTKRDADDAWDMALREVNILAKLSHPNIINIQSVFRTHSRIYLFQELVAHGDLFSFMAKRDMLEEVEAFPIVWQVLKALEFLHSNHIVHRDLKPENILCATREIGGRIIVTDFGTARLFTAATRCTTNIGTPEFSAPEVLQPSSKGYSKEVDLWSLGIIVHNLLVPRSSMLCAPSELTELFREGDLSYLEIYPEISDEAKNFVAQLICINPKKRMSATKAMQHKWLSRHQKELDDLYERATRNWTGRQNGITIQSIGFEEPWLPNPAPAETLDQSDSEMGEVAPIESQMDSELNASGWIPESPEVQSLYDKVARDGKLRTAAQLQREAEGLGMMDSDGDSGGGTDVDMEMSLGQLDDSRSSRSPQDDAYVVYADYGCY